MQTQSYYQSQHFNQSQQINLQIVPVTAISPINSIKKRSSCQVFTTQMMIPFPNFSIKVQYMFLFIAFKLYVTIQLTIIPMLEPSQYQISQGDEENFKKSLPFYRNISLQDYFDYVSFWNKPIIIGFYEFDYLRCQQCFLGVKCEECKQPKNKKELQIVKRENRKQHVKQC